MVRGSQQLQIMRNNITHKLGAVARNQSPKITLTKRDPQSRESSSSARCSSRRKYLQVTSSASSFCKLTSQNSIPSLRVTLPTESTLPSSTQLRNEELSAKKSRKSVRVHKSKPCSQPKIQNVIKKKQEFTGQSPMELLVHLKIKCKAISPIQKLHHLLNQDKVLRPSTNKLKVMTKEIPVRQITLKR